MIQFKLLNNLLLIIACECDRLVATVKDGDRIVSCKVITDYTVMITTDFVATVVLVETTPGAYFAYDLRPVVTDFMKYLYGRPANELYPCELAEAQAYYARLDEADGDF